MFVCVNVQYYSPFIPILFTRWLLGVCNNPKFDLYELKIIKIWVIWVFFIIIIKFLKNIVIIVEKS
jgi:hypothetical protein